MRILFLGLALLWSSGVMALSPQLTLCENAPDSGIAAQALKDCHSECLALHAGLREPVFNANATDDQKATYEQNKVCHGVRAQWNIVKEADALMQELQSTESDMNAIIGWDAEQNQFLPGVLGGRVTDEAAGFFSRKNTEWQTTVRTWIDRHCDNDPDVACADIGQNALIAPGQHYGELFPSGKTQLGSAISAKNVRGAEYVPTEFQVEILRYRQQLETTTENKQEVCSTIDQLQRRTNEIAQNEIEVLGLTLVEEALGKEFVSYSLADFLALQHAAHVASARAEFLDQITQDQCRASSVPCIPQGVLPGQSTCDGGATSDATAPFRYFIDRLLPGVTNQLLVLVILLSVIGVVVGGLFLISSAFDVELRERGKRAIAYALGGMVVALLAYFIVRFITNISF